jgi:hypothetical protein
MKKQTKLKIGDKAIIVDIHEYHGYGPGDIVQILKVSKEEPFYYTQLIIDGDNKDNLIQWVYSKDLKPL